MTAVAKRQWGPQRSLSEGISSAIEWLDKVKQKNILSVRPPTLYQAYLVGPIDGLLDWGKPLSEVFRWSNKDTPATNRARDSAIRLLAVAFKTHFFLERNDLIAHEPYLFIIPDIAIPHNVRYGIIYRLDKSAKTILVGETDLESMATSKVRTGRFPVVLIDEPTAHYKWFHMKHWASLAEQYDGFLKITKPWAEKQEKDIINSHTDINSFPYGTPFEIPYHLKDIALAVGMKWARGIKRWYLPLWFDIDQVKIFIDYVEATTQHQKLTKTSD